VQNGSEDVARKLLHVDVVLVVSMVRAKRGRSVGMTVSRDGGGGLAAVLSGEEVEGRNAGV
jgi:hypothetical protein